MLKIGKRLTKYLERVGIALSVLLNVLLGGPSNQTFSARNWGWKLEGYPNLVWLIDFLASKFEEDHCQHSWEFWAFIIKNHGETRYEHYQNLRKE
jgi:hypothetical protein